MLQEAAPPLGPVTSLTQGGVLTDQDISVDTGQSVDAHIHVSSTGAAGPG